MHLCGIGLAAPDAYDMSGSDWFDWGAAMALRDESCVPCRDGGPTLAPEELTALQQELPGHRWLTPHRSTRRNTADCRPLL